MAASLRDPSGAPDPDAKPEDFLGEVMAPLIEKVAAVYEQCDLSANENITSDADIEWVKDFMAKAPIPKDLFNDPIEELVAQSGIVVGIEDILGMFGADSGMNPMESWYGYITPLFAIGIGNLDDEPSSGVKLKLIPTICKEAYEFFEDSPQYDLATKAGPELNLGHSLDKLHQAFTDKFEPVAESCIPLLIASAGIVPPEVLPQIFPGVVVPKMTEMSAIELKRRMEADGKRDVGFDLLKVLDRLNSHGVPQVHVYGEESIDAWADKLAGLAEGGSLSKILAPSMFSHIVGLAANHGKFMPPQGGPPQCTDLIKDLFPWLIGRKFAEKVLTPTGRNEAEEVAWQVVEAFSKNLDQLPWIDTETKKAAKLKLRHIRVKIGWPHWLFENSNLLHFYSFALTFDNGMKFAEMVWKTKFHMLQRAVARVDTPKDWESMWVLDPTVMNMVYNQESNDIVGFAAFLQKPQFDEERPMSFNFGFLGAVYGHELSHGFDSNGGQRGPWGNVHDWWSASAKEKFHEQQACFIKQYSSWPIRGDRGDGSTDMQSETFDDGEKCLGENIADSGGLGLAFMAYKTWQSRNGEEKRLPGLEKYSPEQLFFMRYGAGWCDARTTAQLDHQISTEDPHSVSRMRSVGAAQNSRAFAKVWGCAEGTPMNPKVSDKCELWGIDMADSPTAGDDTPEIPGGGSDGGHDTPGETPVIPDKPDLPQHDSKKFDGEYHLKSDLDSNLVKITINQGRWSGYAMPTHVISGTVRCGATKCHLSGEDGSKIVDVGSLDLSYATVTLKLKNGRSRLYYINRIIRQG